MLEFKKWFENQFSEDSYQWNPPNSKYQPQPVGEVQRDPNKPPIVSDIEQEKDMERQGKKKKAKKKTIKDKIDSMYN